MRRISLFVTATLLYGCALITPAEVPTAIPPTDRVVVFDIDGTLTPHNLSVYEARAGAAQAVSAFAAKGYKIVYLTTRVPLFQPGLPNWLKQNGFPDGMLHVAQTAAERAQADKFKSQVLSAYKQHGWRLAYAYGDSATDFRAYAEAGIPREHVFALKRAGSQECQDGLYQTCLGGWTEHLPYIESQVPGTK